MTFTTLQYAGVERPLADWGVSQARRELSNQARDHFACDMILPADTAPDPIPYGGQIILRIGRAAASGTGTTAAGLPLKGLTAFTGGTQWFVGWRVETFRSASPDAERLEYKFAGPWEFLFERLVFRKLQWNYNGVGNVADWRSQVVLGESVTALVGVADTVPGTTSTNLMSIAQQVREIIAYVAMVSNITYGSDQIQCDGITAGGGGSGHSDTIYRPAWDSSGNYTLYTDISAKNIQIPDFIAGAYVASWPFNPNSNNTLQTQPITNTNVVVNTVLRAPLDSVNDITCAEALRKMLRWIGPMGDPVVWFDYTATPPAIHISTRDILPSVSLPSFPSQSLKIKRRDDLIPAAVDLEFRVRGTWDGTTYTQIIRDIAGTIGGNVVEGIGQAGALQTLESFATSSPMAVPGTATTGTQGALLAAGQGFEAVTQTFDMEGTSANISTCQIATVPVNLATPSGGGSALAFWKTVFPEMADISSPDFAAGAPAVTVVDDTGATVDTSVFQYLLTRGQVAPWMLSGNLYGGSAAQSKKCVVSATFNGTGNNTIMNGGTPVAVPVEGILGHPKHATVTLITIPGGTYAKQTITSVGEIIPFGLAGYIYRIASIPQYEGSFTIQETEITDQCPLGHNLNLTGSLAEWSTMNACIQEISYDITTGKTTLTFGPAAHLGARDFVERLRVNRGPRWYNLNGNNVTNAAGGDSSTQLGSDTAQLAGAHGPPAHNLQIFPTDITDIAAHLSAYPYGVPGITHDSRTAGQPNYGNITGLSAPTQPTIFLAQGTAGSLGSTIRISVSDLLSGAEAWFQPCQVCVDGTTWKTAYVLMTRPA